MAEEIGFENGRNSNFQGLVTLTLTLDPAIRHTVVHHSLMSTYIPNFIQIEETFCGRTDGRTDERTYECTDRHFSPSLILLGQLLEVDLKMVFGWLQMLIQEVKHISTYSDFNELIVRVRAMDSEKANSLKKNCCVCLHLKHLHSVNHSMLIISIWAAKAQETTLTSQRHWLCYLLYRHLAAKVKKCNNLRI